MRSHGSEMSSTCFVLPSQVDLLYRNTNNRKSRDGTRSLLLKLPIRFATEPCLLPSVSDGGCCSQRCQHSTGISLTLPACSWRCYPEPPQQGGGERLADLSPKGSSAVIRISREVRGQLCGLCLRLAVLPRSPLAVNQVMGCLGEEIALQKPTFRLVFSVHNNQKCCSC